MTKMLLPCVSKPGGAKRATGTWLCWMELTFHANVRPWLVKFTVSPQAILMGPFCDRSIKLVMLAVMAHPISVLGFTALAAVWPDTLASLANRGPHGFSEVLYAYASGTANNGSAFAGLNANTPFFNTTIGLAMLAGRYLTLLPMLALAGSLAAKPTVPAGPGTFPTATPLFMGLLVFVVVVVGGLTFLPSLALGPVVEQLQMLSGQVYP